MGRGYEPFFGGGSVAGISLGVGLVTKGDLMVSIGCGFGP